MKDINSQQNIIDWQHWISMGSFTLEEIAALMAHLNPYSPILREINSYEEIPTFYKYYHLLNRAINNLELPHIDGRTITEVKMKDLQEWLKTVPCFCNVNNNTNPELVPFITNFMNIKNS